MLQILFLFAALLPAQVETTFTVEYSGKKYEFHIADQDLQKTPAWPATQENPPLSPRRATDIASKQLATLLPNGKDWRLYSVTLRPMTIVGSMLSIFWNRYAVTIPFSKCLPAFRSSY